MTGGETRRIVLCCACALLALAAIPFARASASRAGPLLQQSSQPTFTLVREHRYRMAAGIRPLLLFWIMRDNVGEARVVWRQGPGGERGYELLIGSDPQRAPRGINRWGYLDERTGQHDSATLIGVMKETDEQSIEEAKAKLAKEGQEGYYFKMIRQSVGAGETTSDVVTLHVTSDYSFRELDPLLKAFGSSPGITKTKRAKLAPATRPGFLAAVVELVGESVDAARRATRGQRARTIPFTFNAVSYDLTLRSSEYLEKARFGDQDFTHVVRNQFETFNREAKTREQFTLVCGVDGAYREVPVFISYQPRWWFKAELVLDDRGVS
jgi:hypothetical protein